MTYEEVREAVLDLVCRVDNQDQVEPLQKLMDKIDMWPAATKYHHWWPGGLLAHVYEVMTISLELLEVAIRHHGEGMDAAEMLPGYDELLIAALVHDMEKTEKYRPINGVGPNGVKSSIRYFDYEWKPYIDDAAHALLICQEAGLRLDRNQMHAISLHHGGWSAGVSSPHVYSASMTAFSTLLHSADMMSARIYGETPPPIGRIR